MEKNLNSTLEAVGVSVDVGWDAFASVHITEGIFDTIRVVDTSLSNYA